MAPLLHRAAINRNTGTENVDPNSINTVIKSYHVTVTNEKRRHTIQQIL